MLLSQYYTPNSPFAKKVARRLKGKDALTVLRELNEYLKRLQYIDFGPKDTFQTPDQMFSRGNYDCEDGAGFVATVLKLLGIPHTIYVGYVIGYPKWHVWVEVPINGEIWLFETTAPMVLPKSKATVQYVPIWRWDD